MRNLIFSFFVFYGLICFSVARADTATEIMLNGEKALVYFNDGDTFKVLSGKLAGKRSRLEGFNALESFGAVQRWGSFSAKELLEIAYQATDAARQGGWTCHSDLKADGYGRILSTCPDLAAALISKGLAHVMTVTKEAGNAEWLILQHEAMANRLGMWKKGMPAYIVTSLHSSDESAKQKEAYDRLVSTEDGHSELVKHRSVYNDCQELCYSATQIFDQTLDDTASCMTYVHFEHRYGSARATCL
jgi:endonuclease YncB( thermonuclease family)